MERKRKSRSHPDNDVTPVGVEGDVTPNEMSHPDVTPEYKPIYRYLADDTKRGKLRDICDSLKRHNVLEHVRFGIEGPTFDIVDEMVRIVDNAS